VRAQTEAALGRRRPAEMRWELARTDHADADTEESASALLRLVARDRDEEAVGRRLGAAAVELALASYPGFHVTAPPGKGTPYGVFETAYVAQDAVAHTAVLPDGERVDVPPPGHTAPSVTSEPEFVPAPEPAPEPASTPAPEPAPAAPAAAGPVRRAPLGRVAGARSGDKGGDANIGVWARHDPDPERADALWHWLRATLTVERLRALLPECAELDVVRHELPNLRALNFVVTGLLGEGVAARHRFDPQAKGLGEWLRARHLDIPAAFLDTPPPAPAGASGGPDHPREP
jgi:hypothetical protein